MGPEHIRNIIPRVMDQIQQAEAKPLPILVDTREQEPWTFAGLPVVAVRAKLDQGDYGVPGVDFAVERKSPQDFIGSISFGRERFERELGRLQANGGGAIVIEGNLADLLDGSANRRPDGTQRVHTNAVLGSIGSFQCRFGVPAYFAGSRQQAERLAYYLLRHAGRVAVEEAAEAPR